MAHIQKLDANKYLAKLTTFVSGSRPHLYATAEDPMGFLSTIENSVDWELVDDFLSMRYYAHDCNIMAIVLHHIPTDGYVMVRWDHQFDIEGDPNDLSNEEVNQIMASLTPATTLRLKPRQGKAPDRVIGKDGDYFPTCRSSLGWLVADPCGRFLWCGNEKSHIFNPDRMEVQTYWPTKWTRSGGTSDVAL